VLDLAVRRKDGEVGLNIAAQINKALNEPLFRAYIEKLQREDLSPLTISKYAANLHAYEKWLGGEPVSAESAKNFLHWLRSKDCSWSTVEAYYHAIKPFLADLSIVLHIKYRDHKKVAPRSHSPDEIRAILDIVNHRKDKWRHLSKRDNLMILVLAYTGIRRGELMALTPRDINFHTNRIRVLGKGDKERLVPIESQIRDLLKEHIKHMKLTDRIFPLSSSRVSNIIRQYARRAGVNDIHVHSFRHYCATQLIKNGVNVRVVQQILGHSDINTTMIYVDTCDEEVNDAVAHLPNLIERVS
jgi:integrase/recombinase XerD